MPQGPRLRGFDLLTPTAEPPSPRSHTPIHTVARRSRPAWQSSQSDGRPGPQRPDLPPQPELDAPGPLRARGGTHRDAEDGSPAARTPQFPALRGGETQQQRPRAAGGDFGARPARAPGARQGTGGVDAAAHGAGHGQRTNARRRLERVARGKTSAVPRRRTSRTIGCAARSAPAPAGPRPAPDRPMARPPLPTGPSARRPEPAVGAKFKPLKLSPVTAP